ncbi:hypothetical protein DFJ73DRAFT_851556 [Zopfochytrium polystomum]|nr:hypothetical protein DFJ73DRAFT_851556 [Zopfochytrium polystomum]
MDKSIQWTITQWLPPRVIVSEIAVRLHRADLLCFRSACRLFAQAADPLAFAAVEIAFPLRTALSPILCRVGRYVRRLALTSTHGGADDPIPDDMFVASEDPVVTEWVVHLTAVESVHCKFEFYFGRGHIPTLLQVLSELPAPERVGTIRLEPYTEAFNSDRLCSAVIFHIKRFPNLRHVVLAYVSDFDHVEEIAKTWPELESLHVSLEQEDYVGTDPFDDGVKLPNLRRLVLLGYSCGERTLAFLESVRAATLPIPADGVSDRTEISALTDVHLFLEQSRSKEYSKAAHRLVYLLPLPADVMTKRAQSLFPGARVEVRTNREVGGQP